MALIVSLGFQLEISIRVQTNSVTNQREETMNLNSANHCALCQQGGSMQVDPFPTEDLGIDTETEFWICKQGYSLIKKIGEGHFGKVMLPLCSFPDIFLTQVKLAIG